MWFILHSVIDYDAPTPIGRLIINRCNRLGIETLIELSKRCGVSKNYIAMIATGKRARPSAKVAIRIADALDVDAREFLELVAGQ